MRKLFLLLVFLLFLLQGMLWSQVKLSVELQSDTITYLVKLRSDTSVMAPFNTTNNIQVAFIVPTGGFQPSTPTSIKGLWSEPSIIITPIENPNMDYITYNLQGGTSDIGYVTGEEVDLFSFQNTGSCTGELAFVLEEDPFFPPNSQDINLGNQITVLGIGFTNAFTGIYGPSANCLEFPAMISIGGENMDSMAMDSMISLMTDTIVIETVALTSPSDCGASDGSITILATHPTDNTLQYSVDGGNTWNDSSAITGLQAGVTYNIQIRDILELDFATYGPVTLESPTVANIQNIDAVTPTCTDSNGSITIEATNAINDAPLQFSIDGGVTFQDSTGVFQNLPAQLYDVILKTEGTSCVDTLDPILLVFTPCPDTIVAEIEEEMEEEMEEIIDSVGFAFTENTTCPFAYILEAKDGVFTVSLLSDTTLAFPENITSSIQVAFKIPTGSFDIDNFTTLVEGAGFGPNSFTSAPPEAPDFDYISFDLTSRGTQAITYEKGKKIPLFSFENKGNCTGDIASLVDNDSDPIRNNSTVNINQQLTVAGVGIDAEVCISMLNISDCGNEIGQVDPMPVDTTTDSMPVDTIPNPCATIGLTIDNVLITPPNDCKEELGNIMAIVTAADSITTQYSIDSGATWVARANFDSLEEGVYHLLVRPTDSTCVINYQNNPIQLVKPDSAKIVTDLDDLSFCENETKNIRLLLNQAIDSFTIEGEGFTNATTSEDALNFEAVFQEGTATYTITLVGDSGCATTDSVKVLVTPCAIIPPCELFNGLDTLRAELGDSLAKVCIPITDMDIEEFQYIQNGETVEMTFGECNNSSIFYSFNTASLGTPPFILQEWIVNSDTLSNFEFNTSEELINKLNEFDQEANWVATDESGFIGISSDNDYGPLRLLHIGSNTTLELQLNNMNIFFQSLLLDKQGIQTYILRDTMEGCQDTLVIKIDDNIPNEEIDTMSIMFMDTLFLSTMINTSLMDQCLIFADRSSDSLSIQECSNPQNGFLLLQDKPCFNYTPTTDFIGQDSFCLSLCTPTSCDTTFIVINVTEAENPTEDTKVSLAFMDTIKLQTIINTALINQCISNSSTIIDSLFLNECSSPKNGITFYEENCFDYTPDLGFLGRDSFCIEVCSSPMMCDTTLIIIEVITDTSSSSLQLMDDIYLSTIINTPLTNQCFDEAGIDSISVYSPPVNGRYNSLMDACFNYTPDLDFNGQDSICLVVCSPTTCDTVSVFITIQEDDLIIHNGFSPNNDNVNNLFIIQNIEKYPDNELQIFNRWGNIVYEKKNYKNNWDGTFDSILLPDGIYFYVLSMPSNESTPNRSGYIVLRR